MGSRKTVTIFAKVIVFAISAACFFGIVLFLRKDETEIVARINGVNRMFLNETNTQLVKKLLADADYLVVGAGLSGALFSDLYARKFNKKVVILEKRDHLAGNCYDYIDTETNLLCSLYGPHLFHTNIERVRQYLLRFGHWEPYEHRVVAVVDDITVPVPVNIDTYNALIAQGSSKTFHQSAEMDAWLKKVQVHYDNPVNRFVNKSILI